MKITWLNPSHAQQVRKWSLRGWWARWRPRMWRTHRDLRCVRPWRLPLVVMTWRDDDGYTYVLWPTLRLLHVGLDLPHALWLLEQRVAKEYAFRLQQVTVKAVTSREGHKMIDFAAEFYAWADGTTTTTQA